ncbi:phosphotriesterase family protein [Spirosoma fluviale]|uniref:Phosphotriesterase-related protein n=1 Tax=Spirosoma fluviale TaxID=1597977 RepID=A0A286GMT5_9BACT|nr:aryldialkylphosphatase [Spirosoma fluviale]SOD96853.1 phosphotriesterase-related protein [Spirosoma fluviale]
MSFIRTVLGDIPATQAGITYAHEHLIIEESFPTLANADFLLNDVDKVAAELTQVYRAGGRTMVDTMPANCGRNVLKLAEVSRRTGIQIVVPTGIHLEIYYPTHHWRYQYSEDQLTRLFIADVEEGIDAFDYNGPVVERTAHKAGMIKLATGDDPITPHQELIFRAVVNTHRATGVPILTHTNAGLHALAQASLFDKLGADLSHVVISHVDRYTDLSYHRDLLQTGIRVEFDSAFRWKKEQENWTYRLLEALLPDFPDQITVGMDAARNTYWQSYGGSPGLTYLLTTFRDELYRRGLGEYWNRLMIDNPAALYSFCKPNLIT